MQFFGKLKEPHAAREPQFGHPGPVIYDGTYCMQISWMQKPSNFV